MRLKKLCIKIVSELVKDFNSHGHPLCPVCGWSADDGTEHGDCIFIKALDAPEGLWKQAGIDIESSS